MSHLKAKPQAKNQIPDILAALERQAERIKAESALMTIEQHRTRLQRNVLLLRGPVVERPVLDDLEEER